MTRTTLPPGALTTPGAEGKAGAGATARAEATPGAEATPNASRDDRRRLGALAEDIVAARLAAAGWTILARNWRCRAGELDIVARDADVLVVVEVRARRSRRFGTPEDSVDGRKQARLARLGEAFVAAAAWTGPWRIDVVAVDFDAGLRVVRHAHYRHAVGF